jgi:hypothetical protein
MIVMALIGLPIVAAVFGGGDPISDMPRLAGWGTFTIEHAIYGAVLGLWPLLRGSTQTATRRSTLSGSKTSTRLYVALRCYS